VGRETWTLFPLLTREAAPKGGGGGRTSGVAVAVLVPARDVPETTMAHTQKSIVKVVDGLRAPRIPEKVSMTKILGR
jgi:hypothetical protein